MHVNRTGRIQNYTVQGCRSHKLFSRLTVVPAIYTTEHICAVYSALKSTLMTLMFVNCIGHIAELFVQVCCSA